MGLGIDLWKFLTEGRGRDYVTETSMETRAGMAAVLAAGTDYMIEYANNQNAGTAIVTITGTGRYKGQTV